MSDEKLKHIVIEYKQLCNARGWLKETRDSIAAVAFSTKGIEMFGSITNAMEKILAIAKESTSEHEAMRAVVKMIKSK